MNSAYLPQSEVELYFSDVKSEIKLRNKIEHSFRPSFCPKRTETWNFLKLRTWKTEFWARIPVHYKKHDFSLETESTTYSDTIISEKFGRDMHSKSL